MNANETKTNTQTENKKSEKVNEKTLKQYEILDRIR